MSADLILFNSRIGFANGYETATSVAIGNGRFIVIGDDDETAALAGPDTRKIDLGGRRVLPGMIDSHFHVHEWALNRKNLALTDLTALAELQGLIQSRAAVEPAGAWIVGQGFNETDWDRPHMPTAADLDAVAPHHPVIIWRCDMHLAVANSRALRLAGITANTPDPPDGIIDRDAHGRPTGVLRELAIDAVRNVIAMPKDDVVMDALQDAVGALHRLGLTGVQDIRLMGGREGADALRAWQKLDAAGRLDMRCWVSLPGERLDAAIALGLQSGFGNDRLRIGHVKYFADGGMGARTAWMLSPYLDGGCGQAQMPMDALGRAIARAEQSGLAVMVHAVGDRAGREVIGLMETHAGKHAWLPMPHSIEHLQMLNAADVPRLARLGVTACMQPHNMLLDINMIETAVGPAGCRAYAFNDVLASGARLVFGSDCPVGNPSPLKGIHAAVCRQRADGTPAGGWHPQWRVDVDASVAASTISAAAGLGADAWLGSLSPGKRADLVVLDRDIYTIDPMEIAETQVDMTVFDGRVVFER